MRRCASAPERLSAGFDTRGVERGKIGWVQPQVGCSDEVGKLRQRGRAGNRRGEARACQQPRHGYHAGSGLVERCHRIQRGQDPQPARVQILLHHIGATLALAGIDCFAVLAGQEPGGQCVETDDTDIVLQTQRLQCVFESAC